MKSEFQLIQYIKSKSLALSCQPSAVRIGIGDDCAVIPKNERTDLVITTDLLMEDVDFRVDWTTPEFLGHKALAVSLSDVAAMGAKPAWSLLSIGIPEKVWKTDFVERFYDGWFDLAKKYNVELIGGDVSRTTDKIVVDSIVAGEVKKGKAILRSGANVGDLIYVTGELGGAACGLKLLESGERFEKTEHKNLLLRQLQPNPQTKIGQVLGVKNLATAMIDLSDGLSSDLAHLCQASKVGAKIFAGKIPFHKNLISLSKSEKEKFSQAFDGGEDFELLFTANPENNFRLEKELKNHSFTLIGEVTTNVETVELVSGNESTILQPKGFRHF